MGHDGTVGDVAASPGRIAIAEPCDELSSDVASLMRSDGMARRSSSTDSTVGPTCWATSAIGIRAPGPESKIAC